MQTPSVDIETRINTSLAVRRYIRTAGQMNDATRDFTEACDSLRTLLGRRSRFVVEECGHHYLVTSDAHGNFEIEQVPML